MLLLSRNWPVGQVRVGATPTIFWLGWGDATVVVVEVVVLVVAFNNAIIGRLGPAASELPITQQETITRKNKTVTKRRGILLWTVMCWIWGQDPPNTSNKCTGRRRMFLVRTHRHEPTSTTAQLFHPSVAETIRLQQLVFLFYFIETEEAEKKFIDIQFA